MAALLAAGLLLAGCASTMQRRADEGTRAPGLPPHPGISQIARRLPEAVNEGFSGIAVPKQALDDAARDVDEVLRDY